MEYMDHQARLAEAADRFRAWVVVAVATFLWGMIGGISIVLYPDGTATVTEQAELIGWIMISGSLWYAIDAVRWIITGREIPAWWLGLGAVFASNGARAPMAIWRAADGAIPWAQAINISSTVLVCVFALLGLWVQLMPDAVREMRRIRERREARGDDPR